MSGNELIERLGLQPHPEGGYFLETYRAEHSIKDGDRQRAVSTAIYYLLCEGAVSHLHRIDADELWHAYAGSGLRVHIFDESGYRFLDIGTDLSAGQRPQGVVPAGAWFGAELLNADDYALVGCTVAPGFEFTSFELADRALLLARYPEQRSVIERLTAPSQGAE